MRFSLKYIQAGCDECRQRWRCNLPHQRLVFLGELENPGEGDDTDDLGSMRIVPLSRVNVDLRISMS